MSRTKPRKRHSAVCDKEKSCKTTKVQKCNSDEENAGLKREMGMWSVISYMVGGIIGTGVFISPSGVLEHSGSPGAALIIWISCGGIATLTGLCFAELGTTFPHSGSSYYYVKLAFGDFAAFLFQWVDIILRKSTTGCVRYMTFSIYFLQPFYGLCKPATTVVKLVAALSIVSLAYLNCQGVVLRAGFQMLTTCAKLLAIALIFGLGLYHLYSGGFMHLTDAFQGSSSSPSSIAMAVSYGLYAYSGWDVMNTAVEEIRSPNTALPLGVLISLMVVTLAYTVVNVAYFLVLDRSDVLDSPAVATVFAAQFTPLSAWLVSILVSVSAIGACNVVVFQTSRYLYAVAREKQLPKYVAGLSLKDKVPQPAILTMAVLTLMCLAVKDINQLMVYYGILKWSMTALPIAAQLYLRAMFPDIKRPLKLPLFLPVLTLLIMLCLLIIPIYQDWYNSFVAIILCFACLPIYLFFFIWTNKPACMQSAIDRLDDALATFAQKLMLVEIASNEQMEEPHERKKLIS